MLDFEETLNEIGTNAERLENELVDEFVCACVDRRRRGTTWQIDQRREYEMIDRTLGRRRHVEIERLVVETDSVPSRAEEILEELVDDLAHCHRALVVVRLAPCVKLDQSGECAVVEEPHAFALVERVVLHELKK